LGSAADFTVWADGPGALSYQWYSNNVALTGQTETNLALAGLTANYDATYTVVVTGPYGSVTSSIVLAVTPTLPPATLVPASVTRWIGLPFTLAPASLPNQQLDFQWYQNTSSISGATNSSYTAIAGPASIGNYVLVLSNSFGTSTSTVATVSVLTPPAGYATTIVGDTPIAYLRLDETNGTTAFDYAGGNNGTYFGAVQLGEPGALLFDPDFAVTFPGLTNCFCGDIGPTTINFSGTGAEFSIEAWANGTNELNDSPVIAKGTGSVGENYTTEQFAIDVINGVYRFYCNDAHGATSAATAKIGPDGNWHHLVGVCDGNAGTLTFYVDGEVSGTGGTPAAGILSSTDPVGIGAERSGILPVYDWTYAGTIDEVAIYAYPLTATQVQTHYGAAFGTNTAPFFKSQPVSATNYVNLPVTLAVSAAGSVPLTFQWNKAGVGPVSGATANTFTIANLALSDSGTYTCGITNGIGGLLSDAVTITVLPPPTNPPSIPGLVMHLTFDNTLIDATGRGNDGTNEASGTAVLTTNNYQPGEIGDAFIYQTSVTLGATNASGTNATVVSANYATVGVRPDLQFGTGSFTVSMWIELPNNYNGNDLPFFCDVKGSTFGYPGFSFEPSFGTTEGSTAGWPGGWGFSVFSSSTAGETVYGDQNLINDGVFHNLVYVIDKVNGAVVYVDGLPAHQNIRTGSSSLGVAGAGNIDTTLPAMIGQDTTGVYQQPSQGNVLIDDLGVWNRALTPLEAAAIFTAGSVSQLSFTAPPSITLSAAVLSGSKLQLNWSTGTLQSATNLLGPWTNVTGATPPFTTNTTGPQEFFRVSE
jgi:hypothetical protein